MKKLQLILGPCVMESYDHTMYCADQIKIITDDLDVDVTFKASFDKANRTTIESFRGPGIDKGLSWLQAVKDQLQLPVITDVHTPDQVSAVGDVVDIIQVPAFLCRQTDLLVACGHTGKVVNIKKGQFVSPQDMHHAVQKVKSTGNNNIMLTERGTCFGYRNLVVDYRAIGWMKPLAPVIFDATHSVQLPQAGDGKSAGLREFIPILSRAAIAAGVDGLFFETHPNPSQAKSDGSTVWPMTSLRPLLIQLLSLYKHVQQLDSVHEAV